MRNQEDIRELIILLLIEEINRVDFNTLRTEPENVLPKFLEDTSNHLTELIMDEITFRRHR